MFQENKCRTIWESKLDKECKTEYEKTCRTKLETTYETKYENQVRSYSGKTHLPFPIKTNIMEFSCSIE